MPRRTSLPRRKWAQAPEPRPARLLPPAVTTPPTYSSAPCTWPGCGEAEIWHLRRDDGATPCGRMWCGCRAYLPEVGCG